MNNPDGISTVMQTVARYIVEAAGKPLPDQVTEATKHHLLDTLASMISGSHLPPGEKAIAYIKAQGGTKEASIPGSRIVTTVVNAALAGGMLAHADETDDSHAPSLTHPGCAIIPAALAMAERENASGTALLRAIALGYDISSRVSPALGGYALAASGRDTHAHGTMFGAAAACGSLARLDERQVRHMLSYTSQQASGLSNYARDTEHIEKAFIFGGMPARNGAAAATMVASGMTGIDDVFSGERSLFHAFSSTNANPELLTRGLGETYEIVNTNIKRWTVGSPIQAPLDSLSTLIKEHKLKARDVRESGDPRLTAGRTHDEQPSYAGHQHAVHGVRNAARRHGIARSRSRHRAHERAGCARDAQPCRAAGRRRAPGGAPDPAGHRRRHAARRPRASSPHEKRARHAGQSHAARGSGGEVLQPSASGDQRESVRAG